MIYIKDPVSIGNIVVSGTSGSVLFIDSSGKLAQDNANLFWDNTNKRLGIGTLSPNQALEVNGNVIIGASPSYGPTSALSIKRTISDSSYAFGFTIEGSYTSTSNNAYGMWMQPTLHGSNGGRVSAFYAGAIVNVSTAQSLANADAAYIAALDTKTGAGTVTTANGLYIDSPTIGTTNYLIYGAGTAQSYFGGNVGIGTTSPGAKLEIDATTASVKGLVIKTTDDSQTNNLLQIQNSSGTAGFHVKQGTTADGSTLYLTSQESNGISGSYNTLFVAGNQISLTAGFAEGTQNFMRYTPGVTGSNVGNDVVGLYLKQDLRSSAAKGSVGFLMNTEVSGGSGTGLSRILELQDSGITRMVVLSTGNVGIGTSPSARLHVLGTTEQLRLGYDASNYQSFTLGSDGNMSIIGTGTAPWMGFGRTATQPFDFYYASTNPAANYRTFVYNATYTITAANSAAVRCTANTLTINCSGAAMTGEQYAHDNFITKQGAYRASSLVNFTATANQENGPVSNWTGYQFGSYGGLNLELNSLYAYRIRDLNLGASYNGTDFYAFYMGAQTINASATLTNKWGIYMADSRFINYFAGTIIIGGTTSPRGELDVRSSMYFGIPQSANGYLNTSDSFWMNFNCDAHYSGADLATVGFVIGQGRTANTGGTTLAIIYADGHTVFSGSICTDGAGTNKWEMAGYTASAPSATGYVSVVINGTTYKLLAST